VIAGEEATDELSVLFSTVFSVEIAAVGSVDSRFSVEEVDVVASVFSRFFEYSENPCVVACCVFLTFIIILCLKNKIIVTSCLIFFVVNLEFVTVSLNCSFVELLFRGVLVKYSEHLLLPQQETIQKRGFFT